MKFIPSVFQKAIGLWVSAGKGSASVQAVPGSGKTTLIGYILGFVSQSVKVLVTTFGKKAATALQSKVVEALGSMPQAWHAATLNSVGFAPIRARLKAQGKRITLHGARNYGGKITPDKSMCIIWEMFSKQDNGKRPPEYFAYSGFVKRLVSLAKNEGVGTLVPDETPVWESLIAKQGLFLTDRKANEQRAIEIAQDVLRTSNLWSLEGKIDFDDQLYLIALWDLDLPKQGWIVVDEAQDTNKVQLDMIRRMSDANTRHLLVGDNRQSIYAFRGADSAAIDLASKMFDCVKLPLSVCYRCAKAQVSKANEVIARWYAVKAGREYDQKNAEKVTEVLACDSAPDGKTEALETYDSATFTTTDAILCRNSAPLIKLAYALIRAGVGCHVLGREIGQGLVDLVTKLDASSVDELEARLREYQAREMDKALERGREMQAESIGDQCDCIRLFIDGLSEAHRTIAQLTANITTLFEGNTGVTLATIHKAKGLEFPRVFILDLALIPSKYATQTHQLEQEYNLWYVAETRAMLETYYITSDGYEGTNRSNKTDEQGESEALEIESNQE